LNTLHISVVKELLATKKKILITSHSNPDGDALGSGLALMLFLNQFDHQVNFIIPNAFPDFLAWMPGQEKILIIEQDKDLKTDASEDLKQVTKRSITKEEEESLLFASKVCKHTKSNTIVLARKGQLIASGVGQTSRVDALNQAIKKAAFFKLSLDGAVMASDAFFPFPDCVEIADKAGIRAVIQPGGSIHDQDSIDYCDSHGMAMVFTGFRHFKH